MADLVAAVTAQIATFHGIEPPNAFGTAMVADLAKIIRDFEAVRGTLRFEDEPASFELALLEAATVGISA